MQKFEFKGQQVLKIDWRQMDGQMARWAEASALNPTLMRSLTSKCISQFAAAQCTWYECSTPAHCCNYMHRDGLFTAGMISVQTVCWTGSLPINLEALHCDWKAIFSASSEYFSCITVITTPKHRWTAESETKQGPRFWHQSASNMPPCM